jgi:hypothetical protein
MLFQPSAKVARISIFTIVHHQRRHSAAFRNAVFILSVVDSIAVIKTADATGFKIKVWARPERGGFIVIRRRQITQSKIFILNHMLEPLSEERQCRI